MIAICLSVIPIIVLGVENNVNSYPNLDTNMGDVILSRIYYRLPAFLLGIALAVVKFEYKYVDKLNDGTYPFHKAIIDHLKKKKWFKGIVYSVGLLCGSLPVFI